MSDDIIGMLRDSADDYLGAQTDPAQALKGSVGQPRLRNRQHWQDIADLGWLGLAVPEAQGGLGMSIDAGAALCEVLGRHVFPEPYIAGALMPAVILGAADGAVAAELGAGLAAGTQLLTLAWQEQTGEADTQTYGTRLEGNVLRGRKRFVCALEDDGIMLVVASSAAGTTIVPVAASAAGVSINRCATAQGHYAEVIFAQTPVAHQPLLQGAAADAALARALAWARVAAAAQLAGIARGCLNATVDYVGQRTQFERRLSSFQSVAHRCADMLINVELADAVWLAAAAELVGHPQPAACAAVYAAKARAGDVAAQTGRVAVQLHGAMGFTEECTIGLYLRASMQYNSWLGAPAGLRRQFLASSQQFDLAAEVCHD